MKHFNKLTPAEDERLAMLSEEAAEVIQMIGKIQRHGYESYHPNDPDKITNRELLANELSDVIAVFTMMAIEKDIFGDDDNRDFDKDILDVIKKKLKYTHHQNNAKILDEIK